jgi:hypothetical protein
MGRANQYPIRDAFTPTGDGPAVPLHDESAVPTHAAKHARPHYLTTSAERERLRKKGGSA